MFGKLATALLVLSAALALGPAASAETVEVGDCSKSGLCAGACVGADDCPRYDNLACVGVSYQMPQCVHDPTTYTTDSASFVSKCMGEVCDLVNVVCYRVLKTWCVG